jgi:hypothetical protein
MKEQFLEQVQHFKILQTASGPIKVPILYRDVSSMWVYFSAPFNKIQSILPSDRLKPISLGNGKALYGVVCFEYPNTTVGPYNEIGIGVPCRLDPVINIPILPALFDRFFSVGFYIHHLPVTTQIAYDAGVDLWGLPKFIAHIKFEDTPTHRRCSLQADSKDILTLEVKHPDQPLTLDAYNFHIFSVKDNLLLKTRIQTSGHVWSTRETNSARLHLGNHPLSDELRNLQLDTKPLKTIIYRETQVILPEANNQYTL